jgi:DNA repair exonuclease SbcCD ATPase subunit
MTPEDSNSIRQYIDRRFLDRDEAWKRTEKELDTNFEEIKDALFEIRADIKLLSSSTHVLRRWDEIQQTHRDIWEHITKIEDRASKDEADLANIKGQFTVVGILLAIAAVLSPIVEHFIPR